MLVNNERTCERTDLSSIAGFPLTLQQDGTLRFGEGVVAPEPTLRLIREMTQVLLYPSSGGPDPLYLMYRATGLAEDQRKIRDGNLRYDITVIQPGLVGSEYVKTMGHYHPNVPGYPWTYPEVYQVLHGKGHFLLQRGGEISGRIEDFVVADFEAGDILMVPPFYAHVTVNPGDKPLVMANWVAANFSSVYEPVLLRKGLAYYDVEYKGQSIFMPNDSYTAHSEPRLAEPLDYPELGLYRGKSMYRAWQEGADLEFLTKPGAYETLWRSMGISPRER